MRKAADSATRIAPSTWLQGRLSSFLARNNRARRGSGPAVWRALALMIVALRSRQVVQPAASKAAMNSGERYDHDLEFVVHDLCSFLLLSAACIQATGSVLVSRVASGGIRPNRGRALVRALALTAGDPHSRTERAARSRAAQPESARARPYRAAFNNRDYVAIIIDNYRWRLDLVPGDPRVASGSPPRSRSRRWPCS